MTQRHLPDYLNITEDLGWILLRTVQGGCLGVVLLVLGMAAVRVGDLALEAGTVRPATLIAAAHEDRDDVLVAVGRVGTVGLGAVLGFAVAFGLEQVLMIKAYLRALVRARGGFPDR